MLPDFKDGSAVIEQNPHPCFNRVIEQGYRIYFRGPLRIEGVSFLNWEIRVLQDDTEVGGADFTDGFGHFFNHNVRIEADHQRRGLGNAMYVFAESLVGKTLYNFWDGEADHQSPEAKALRAQQNRPFGPQRHFTP